MQLPDLSLLAVMAVFWATFFVLKAFLFRPLGRILEEREERERAGGEALEKALAAEAAAIEEIDARLTAARREALALREAARAAAAQERHAVLDEARRRGQHALEDAARRLEKDVVVARADLKAGARETAHEIASLALGRRVA